MEDGAEHLFQEDPGGLHGVANDGNQKQTGHIKQGNSLEEYQWLLESKEGREQGLEDWNRGALEG